MYLEWYIYIYVCVCVCVSQMFKTSKFDFKQLQWFLILQWDLDYMYNSSCQSTWYLTIHTRGTRWSSLLESLRSRRKVWIRFPMVLLCFTLTRSFRPHSGPGTDSTSNINEYYEYFQPGKRGRRVRLTPLPPSCADCLEIWEPQTLEALWACTGLYSDCFTFTLHSLAFRKLTVQCKRWWQLKQTGT